MTAMDLVALVMIGFFFILVPAICVWFMFAYWRSARDHAWRRFMRPAPLCPKCGYNLTGRTDTHCPECGTTYTLDELWRLQKTIAAPDKRSNRRR